MRACLGCLAPWRRRTSSKFQRCEPQEDRLPEDEPKRSKVWLRKVTQEQTERSNYIFGNDHPSGNLSKKKMKVRGLKRDRSLCTEPHSRAAAWEVCVHVPRGPMCAARGSIAMAETWCLKGHRQEQQERGPCRSQPTSKVKALFLLGLYKILQKASVSLGTSIWFPGTSSKVNTYTKRRGLKLWPVDGMKVLWTCFRSGVNCVTLDSPLLTAFILSLTLAFAYTPSFRAV